MKADGPTAGSVLTSRSAALAFFPIKVSATRSKRWFFFFSSAISRPIGRFLFLRRLAPSRMFYAFACHLPPQPGNERSMKSAHRSVCVPEPGPSLPRRRFPCPPQLPRNSYFTPSGYVVFCTLVSFRGLFLFGRQPPSLFSASTNALL